jgi:hypothetical protein
MADENEMPEVPSIRLRHWYYQSLFQRYDQHFAQVLDDENYSPGDHMLPRLWHFLRETAISTHLSSS